MAQSANRLILWWASPIWIQMILVVNSPGTYLYLIFFNMAPQCRKDISTSATKVMLCFHVLAPNYSITVADALPIELSRLGSFKVLFVLRLYLYFVSVCLFLCLSFPPFTFSILSHFVTGQWMQKFEWVKIKFASGTTIWMELASNNNLYLSFQTVSALQ